MVTPSSPHDRSDADLLEAYKNGDQDALGALLYRHAPSVHRFGLKMCKDPEDANDIVQETMLAAARGARDFRGASSLTTWLYTIARSFCIKARRRGRAETATLDEEGVMEVASPESTPDEIASDREVGDALEKAIAALEPMYREVLVLRDVEGLTAPEVAEVLGIGNDAVKSRLHRARAAVRERLAPLMTPGIGPRGEACPDVTPLLSRYLEGEIGPQQCKELDAHVAGCARCRGECDSLRRVLALCKNESRGGAVPPSVQAAVQRALRQLEARATNGHGRPPT